MKKLMLVNLPNELALTAVVTEILGTPEHIVQIDIPGIGDYYACDLIRQREPDVVILDTRTASDPGLRRRLNTLGKAGLLQAVVLEGRRVIRYGYGRWELISLKGEVLTAPVNRLKFSFTLTPHANRILLAAACIRLGLSMEEAGYIDGTLRFFRKHGDLLMLAGELRKYPQLSSVLRLIGYDPYLDHPRLESHFYSRLTGRIQRVRNDETARMNQEDLPVIDWFVRYMKSNTWIQPFRW